jgi:hypothetical protein
MNAITVNVKQTITVERIKDLLCSAFEGGTGYWAMVIDGAEQEDMDKVGAEYYHEMPVLGGELKIYDRENYGDDDEAQELLGVINGERIQKALELMAKGKNEDGTEAEYLIKHMDDIVNENEDANTGDIFLQMALFGKLVYS